MNNQILCAFLFFLFILGGQSYSQNEEKVTQVHQVTELFMSEEILPLKLSYAIKDIKKSTNDSTYIKAKMSYESETAAWHDVPVELRVRGHNRLENCYFPPIKIKLSKTATKGTLFEGNKKLKLVFPCFTNGDKNDYVVKEYMAYKLYELVSAYHFKTRMVDLYFSEIKGSKTKEFELKGILIEDNKLVAKRHDGKVLDRFINPLAQDPLASVQNALFQYMIGNTDYSTFAQHNENLIYTDKKIVPLPYDFDMSGLVNTGYSVVSVINNESLPISSVKERLYRGFKRSPNIIAQVRTEFLNQKVAMLEAVDDLEPYFEDPKQFASAKKYIEKFFEVLANDDRFKKEITNKLRTK